MKKYFNLFQKDVSYGSEPTLKLSCFVDDMSFSIDIAIDTDLYVKIKDFENKVIELESKKNGKE